MSRRGGLALAVGVLLATTVTPGRAFAHADMTASNPAPNSVIATPVTQVVLTFSEPVILVQPGVTVSDGKTAIPTTPTIADKTVTAVLATPIGAGTYDVTWKVKAGDGHETTASYSFSIAQDVVAPNAPGAPSATISNPGNSSTTSSNPVIQPRYDTTTTTPATASPTTTNKARNWLIYALIAGGIVIAALIIGAIVRLIRKRR